MAKPNYEDNDSANIAEIVKYRKQQAAKPAPKPAPAPAPAPAPKPTPAPAPKPKTKDVSTGGSDGDEMYTGKPIGQKKGGPVKCMASGGLTSRGDGVAQRGKTKCKYR
jgi:outer membrane biosynthesis protein TonB